MNGPTSLTTTTSGGRNKKTRVQLTLHAAKLHNVAGAFKGVSDPFAVVTLLASDSHDQPVVLGKTEVIKNSLNPHWTKAFFFDYELGKPNYINVGIYDEIRKSKTDKLMGSAVFEIGEILGSRGSVKAKKLKKGGTLFARVEKAIETPSGDLTIQFRGLKLRNVDGFFGGKSDPFFELSRRIEGPSGFTWSTVYRSEHVMDNLNPKWEPLTVSLNRLCDGDMDRPIRFSVLDWEKSGKHQAMGAFETTVKGLIAAKAGDVETTARSFKLVKKGRTYGSIVVVDASVTGGNAASASIVASPFDHQAQTARPNDIDVAVPPVVIPPPAASQERPTFVDYIGGGCELQMSVAIDFTGSNGDPRIPGTLHYRHPDGSLNDYEKAITAVGAIIAKYDADQKFPVWGFGAKYGGVVQHCFQVGSSPEATGISGILEGYRSVFQTPITMSGPTVFTEVIGLAASQAVQRQEAAKRIGQQSYTILLILTDGSVSDVNQTKEAVKAASGAPLSIVIVGIGRADFSAMQFLDDFDNRRGRERDIVQFVEFEAHKHNKTSLTRATLEEIPDQLVDYFYSRGIMPLPKTTQSLSKVVADDYNEDVDIDLTLDVNSEGEFSLAGNNGLYVDNSYGVSGTKYTGLSVLPPPSAPSFSGGSFASTQQAYNPTATSSAPPQPYRPDYSSSSLGYQPSVAVPVSSTMQVQLPPGVTPGMQIQVQNPKTGQMMIVTVPQGVAPGGLFLVSY